MNTRRPCDPEGASLSDALLVAAALFAVAAGANDGSSVLAASLRVAGVRPLAGFAILVGALSIGPWLLFGTGVATTLSHGLVPASGRDAQRVLLAASLSAVVVVYGLVRAGMPTSLTLALVGAVTGAGLGMGLPVDRQEVEAILAAGLLAPVLSGALALVMSPLVSRAAGRGHPTRLLRRWHGVAFCLQCLAYSANGGQKVLAVFAVAAGATSRGVVHDPWWLAVLVAVLFAIGVLAGLRAVSAKLGRQVMSVQLRHAVVAETCAFTVVLGAGVAGVPLTMSQSVAGALVGTGASETRRRVRWPAVARLAGAWAVTLPASISVAIAAGRLAKGMA